MIEGLSNVRRCPRIGYIRLGIKAKNSKGVEYPKEVDYFILDPKSGNPQRDQELKDEFTRLYGEKPKSIKIMFPPADREKFMDAFYKRYGKSSLLKCKGTGKVATCAVEEFADGLEVIDHNSMGQPVVKCLGKDCIYQNGEKEKSCNRLGTIQVLLPDLKSIGVWQISTTSFNSIANMNSALDYLEGIGGRYYMIPLNLMRIPQEITYEGKKSTHYVLQIDMNISLASIQQAALVDPKKSQLSLLPLPDEKKPELLYPENDVLSDESLSAEKVLNDTKGRVVGEGPAAKLKPASIDDYGDVKRFPKQNHREATKVIDSIKKGRKSLGEDKFQYLLGNTGYESVAQITTMGVLKNLLRAMLSEHKSQQQSNGPTKEQQKALGLGDQEPEEA